MKIMRDTLLLFRRKMLETLRQPAWVASGLSAPLLYLALFAPLLKGLSPGMAGMGGVLDSFVPGVLALMAFGAGMGSGWVVVWEVQSGVVEHLRVTPASRFSLMMGAVLKDVVMFIVPALIVILAASLFGFHPHWAGLAVLIILFSLLTAVVSAASGALGLLLKDIGSLAAVVTSLQLPVTLLAGVLLPLSMGPAWLLAVAHFNPMYYAVEASRVLGGGVIASMKVLQAFLVMAPLTALTLWWATGVYRRAVS